MKKVSNVYLLHFSRPFHHARHYIGFTENLNKRLTDHLCGMGARLLEVITQDGIEWMLARTWPGADRNFERRLKRRKEAPALCPVCSGEKALQRAKSK